MDAASSVRIVKHSPSPSPSPHLILHIVYISSSHDNNRPDICDKCPAAVCNCGFCHAEVVDSPMMLVHSAWSCIAVRDVSRSHRGVVDCLDPNLQIYHFAVEGDAVSQLPPFCWLKCGAGRGLGFIRISLCSGSPASPRWNCNTWE